MFTNVNIFSVVTSEIYPTDHEISIEENLSSQYK